MLHYCKKCGRFIERMDFDKKKCDCCESIVYPVPSEYLIAPDAPNVPIINHDLEQQFIDEYIKTSPEFDQYLFDHRKEILANRHAEFQAHMDAGKAILEGKGRVAQCSSCGSTNVSKIGTLDRMVSTGLFGLASSKIGKTHKCNNCGYTW